MEQHPAYEMARDFACMEETGGVRDSVYIPTDEDLTDPDHGEIAALVTEQYAYGNGRRREEKLAQENSVLRDLLRDQGVDPDGVL